MSSDKAMTYIGVFQLFYLKMTNMKLDKLVLERMKNKMLFLKEIKVQAELYVIVTCKLYLRHVIFIWQ